MNLPFEENHFDLYTSFGVYEHFVLRQHKLIFAEAYRVLKPGGIFYLEVPQFWSAWTVRREFRYWFRKCFPPSMVWQSNMRRNYVKRRAEEAGFETVESHVIDSWNGFQKGFSLDYPKLKGVPNPFYFFRAAFKSLAQTCDAREWLGHTLIYIARKPEQKT
jgi:ubiquinone/menaquinone biosynthesis C-methylase UbiE